jgi:hypothetical protein
MNSESSQHDSDAENGILMSPIATNTVKKKAQNSNELFYINRNQRTPLTRIGLITLLVSTALTSMLLSGLGLHFLHLLNPQTSKSIPGQRFSSCGDTSSPARLANCTFDIMSFSWLPTPCSDPELTAEFSQLRSWTWWLDTDQTASVPLKKWRGEITGSFLLEESIICIIGRICGGAASRGEGGR